MPRNRRSRSDGNSSPRLRAYPMVYAPSLPRTNVAEWEIGIYGDLTDQQPDLFKELVHVPRRSRGVIYFDSCGGSAYVGLALACLIRLRGLQAIGVATGECSSAAILPFAACAERYTTPHTTFLFHAIRWTSEADIRVEEAAEWTRHFKQLEEDLDQLVARLFGCEQELIDRWTRPGRFVTGRELAEAGLARLVDLFSGDLWTQINRHGSPQPVRQSASP